MKLNFCSALVVSVPSATFESDFICFSNNLALLGPIKLLIDGVRKYRPTWVPSGWSWWRERWLDPRTHGNFQSENIQEGKKLSPLLSPSNNWVQNCTQVHFLEQNLQKVGFHYHHIVDSLGQKRNTLGSGIYISSIFDRMQKFTTPADKAVSNKKFGNFISIDFLGGQYVWNDSPSLCHFSHLDHLLVILTHFQET